MTISRRILLGAIMFAPFLAARSQRAEAATTCYDPATFSASQRGRRRSLGFKDVSDNPAKHCSICAFFTSTGADCGTCQLLGGGPVTTGSVCNSWAKKP